jgi:hypothetical protein
VQTDWVAHRQSSQDEVDPSSGAALNQDRFWLRSARLQLDVEQEIALGRVALELNGVRELSVRPYEVFLGARAAPVAGLDLGVQFGLIRIPFGFDAVEPVLERPVLERTQMVRALFPGQRDLGIQVQARYRAFRLEVAVMNGAPVGESGALGIELNAAKDMIARLGVEVRPDESVRVAAGVSGASGRGLHLGAAATKDRLAWSDGNEDGFVALSELSVVPGVPATVSRGFSHFALGADARVSVALPVLGELSLRAEIIRAQNLDRALEPADPIASGRDLREIGWAVGAALNLTPLAQLAAQYDTYRPDADARRSVGGEVVPLDPSYSTLAIALSVRLPPLRLIAEYDHNDNRLGRSASGSPARLRDDVFTLRGELGF